MKAWIVLSCLHTNDLESVLDQGLQGVLVVGLQDELCVANPQDVIAHEVSYPAFLVHALAWDYVGEKELRAEAAHDQTLDQLALEPGLLDLRVAFRCELLLELASLLQTAFGNEEIVDTHHGHARLVPLVALVLVAAAAAHDAKRAPIAKREVRAVVLLDLLRRWKSWIPCDSGGFDVFVSFHLVSVDRCIFHNAILDRSHLDISLNAFGAFRSGSYGCYLRGRGRQPYLVTSCLPKLDRVRSAK